MKKLIALTFMFLLSSIAAAQIVFDGYQSYYATLPNNIFKEGSAVPFEGINNTKLVWQGYKLEKAKAIVFPGAVSSVGDLGPSPVIYESDGWACVEGQSRTASGTSVRHYAVYIIDARTPEAAKLYKLSTLFSSCLNVRIDRHGRFLFDSAAYVYSDPSADLPRGVLFSEYVIEDRQFIPTGQQTAAEFVRERNVWKFTIKSKP